MNTLQILNANASSSRNSTSSDSSTSITNSTCQNSTSVSLNATSDCASLASPYTPAADSIGLTTSNNSFDIHCDTDYSHADADFMSFPALTFEDCIAACASYNQRVPSLHPNSTCYGVSFDLVGRNQGYCFLKGIQGITPTSRPGITSSALLVTA